ncbi:hypothetical protein [Agromyces sp. GXQ0307]|uniref:ApeA N-terminal domain 1-containing protein n=1 Tax=Agromyces sp. GXQ0307 TaxID=3377835 RepID=UPI00383AE179
MSGRQETAAVKLPFEGGEHLCTWDLPDGEGGIRPAPGLLTVEPGHWPKATVYGEMPIEWRGGMASFPQRHEFDCLRGTLSSGARVSLMNGELNYWVESQGLALGAFAVISLASLPAEVSQPSFRAVEIQIEGIESVVDTVPIGSVTMPNPNTTAEEQERIWSATLNRSGASLSWERDGIKMETFYTISIRAFDGYEFGMRSSPTIRLSSDNPMTVTDWWLGWVLPLRKMVSALTGAPRAIHYFLGLDAADARARRDQVFGWDLTQTPTDSSRAETQKVKSALKVVADNASLLDLLFTWRTLAERQHPLIEIMGDISTMRDQSPRSRYLMLVQALEGLRGDETRDQRARKQAEYTATRDAFLERVLPTLSEEDAKFLSTRLMKFPPGGLSGDLGAVLKSLPVDVRPELESLPLVATVRAMDGVDDKLPLVDVLVTIRNKLAHGEVQFPPDQVQTMVDVLERVVRSETVRVLDGPLASRTRAAEKPQR